MNFYVRNMQGVRAIRGSVLRACGKAAVGSDQNVPGGVCVRVSVLKICIFNCCRLVQFFFVFIGVLFLYSLVSCFCIRWCSCFSTTVIISQTIHSLRVFRVVALRFFMLVVRAQKIIRDFLACRRARRHGLELMV
jgi:hypothetical protein